jgi:hypothetical protein
MVEQASHDRSYDQDIEPYGENIRDHRTPHYRFAHSARTRSDPDRIPLFLSDRDGEPHPDEYMTPLRKPPGISISSRLLAGALTAAAMAILVALFSSDATRDIVVSAKASIAGVLPPPAEVAQPTSTQLTAADIQLKDPARLSAPANQTPGVRSDSAVAATPTHAEIATASALLLARTYDPDVLGTQDARNIVPDPAMARVWYQRAAELGSPDAQRRLIQPQN